MAKESECQRCGWCCEHICIPFQGILTGATADWARVRKIKIVKRGALHYFVIPHKCEYLKYENAIAACSINTIKPKICRERGCPKLYNCRTVIEGLK